MKGLPELVELICDALNAKIERVEGENSDLNARIGQLNEEKSQLIPECPVNIKLRLQFPTNSSFICKVCFEQFKKDQPIFSCRGGHHLCGDCKAKKTIKVRDWLISRSILF